MPEHKRKRTPLLLAGVALALAVAAPAAAQRYAAAAGPAASAGPAAPHAVAARHLSGLPAHKPAPPVQPLALPGLTARSYTVTLPTGDVVALTSAGAGRYTLAAEPSRTGGTVSVTALGGPGGVRTLYAFPSAASALIRTGRVDPRLFDVHWLTAHGDTGPAGTIPVTLSYAGTRPASLPGATVTWTTRNTVTVRVRAASAARFWAALAGPARPAALTPAWHPKLADGILRAWPAGGRPAAQVGPADQPVFNVAEDITFTRSQIGGMSTLDISVPLINGVSGAGEGQTFFPDGSDCLNPSCSKIEVDYSVPAGVYMIEGIGMRFFADNRWQLIDPVVPQLVVAGNTTVSVDADKAVHYTVNTPRPSVTQEAVFLSARGLPDHKYESSIEFAFYNEGATDLWAVPTQPVTVGSYHSSVLWQLGEAPIQIAAVAPEHLALHAYYPDFNNVGNPFTRFSGSRTMLLADAGYGTAQDFSGQDVHGKVVLIRPAPGRYWIESNQMTNALQAGAVGVIGVPAAVDVGTSIVPFPPGWWLFGTPVPTLPFAEIPASDASTLTGLLQQGPVKLLITDNGTSPYVYNLTYSSEGQAPAAPSYTVTDDQLHQVDGSYQAAGMISLTVSPVRADDVVVGGSWYNVAAPQTTHEYYGPTDPGLLWWRTHYHWLPGDFLAEIDAWDVFDQAGRTAETWWDKSEVPGAPTLAQDAFAAQPGRLNGSALRFETSCSFCRQGDLFFPTFDMVSGQSPRLLDSVYQFDPSQMHLYQNGSEIPQSSLRSLTVYQLPPQQGQYRLTAAAGNLNTTWTFGSSHPAQNGMADGYACLGSLWFNLTDPCAPIPLILLRYNASTNLDNAITAGGEHRLKISTYDQATTQPDHITSLKFWTSTDGGATWQQAHVSETDDSNFVADYSVPALGATSGTLSIRAQATDAAGDTIDQTYYDDYALTAR
jgi:PA domain